MSNINHFYYSFLQYTMRKVSEFGVFSGLYFFLFIPNTGKYGIRKTTNLDTFGVIVTAAK